MKLDPEFIIQNVGDETILVPIGKAGQKFRGVIRLNSTAAFIAEKMKEGKTRDELIEALREEYDGSAEIFERSVDNTISTLKEVGAIVETDD